MLVPENLLYSEEHEWVKREGEGLVRIGITDYAQDALGDIVFVELPAAGSQLEFNETFGEVESTKSVSDIFAPVSGTVTQVNESLEDAPETINQDPYGEGWICVVQLEDESQLSTLLSPEAYAEFTEAT